MALSSRSRAPRHLAGRGPAWIGIGLAVLTGSCRGERDEAPLPRPPAEVDVFMREYRFDYRAPTAATRMVLRARNVGREEHQLRLLALPENLPPLQKQLRSKRRRAVGTLGFIRAMRPGKRGVFAVELFPGRYGLVCFLRDSDGVLHWRKGMVSEFRVR